MKKQYNSDLAGQTLKEPLGSVGKLKLDDIKANKQDDVVTDLPSARTQYDEPFIGSVDEDRTAARRQNAILNAEFNKRNANNVNDNKIHSARGAGTKSNKWKWNVDTEEHLYFGA